MVGGLFEDGGPAASFRILRTVGLMMRVIPATLRIRVIRRCGHQVTGNPEDERLFRERMNLPPSRDTLGLDKLPARPRIPSPDPLAPYLGTEGPRSVTGPPRGSPAGNPQQADEVSPLQLTRERIKRELEDNPRLARTFDANTTAEVGRGPIARQGYQASAIDRAVQEGSRSGIS